MKKTIIATVSIVFIIISLAFTIDVQPRYKNLKILPQDISKEKLDSIMHNFCMSLSVKCAFCHVRNDAEKKWDFASDSVADKLITRKMMLMTNSINKKYFQEEMPEEAKNAETIVVVGCYTCHRGSALPLKNPPPPSPYAPGTQGPQPGNK